MTVVDRNKIDITYTEDNKYILEIVDHLKWNFETRHEHGHILQDKINDYLDYITSGQAEEAKPGLRPVIRIVAKYSYSKYCIEFLERVKKFIKEKDDICDIEWTHPKEDGKFNDGFSDELIIDTDKIYPRLKLNISENKDEIKLEDTPESFVSIRYFDNKYALVLLQDCGHFFHLLSLDELESQNLYTEDNVTSLFNKSLDNLCKNVEYRMQEVTESGIYGIIAGGYFESEILCLNHMWKEISEKLDDDLLISAPAKDLVFFIPLNKTDLIEEFLNHSKKSYDYVHENNIKTIFTKDIFIYSREEDKITISSKYSL